MESLSEQVSKVREAFYGMMYPDTQIQKSPDIEEVYEDRVIVCVDEKYYRVAYTMTDEKPTFAPREQWVEMEETYVTKKSLPEDMLINFGGAVKSLNGVQEPDYAITYGGADLTADFFDAKTEYGFAGASTKRVPILFNHAQPLDTKGRSKYKETAPIGEAELEITDEGVLIKEAILYNRKKYEAYLDDLGWSTGAASHAVIREAKSDGRNYIKQWIVSELSVTPMSAEPRLKNVIALKSLITPEASWQDTSDTEQNNKSTIGDIEMESEIKNMLDGLKGELLQASKEAAENAVKSALEALPEVKSAVAITVTKDEGDKEFPSIAAQMAAVKAYELSNGRNLHPRLKGLESLATKAALGLNEAVPSQGQFLLEPTLSSDFLKPIHEEGPFTSMANRLPVSANSNYGWINGIDETSRATGSRWGGVRGYWRAEASAVTASKPKFRRINWEIKAVEALMYVTEEQLNDAAMTDAIVRQSAIEEINFLVNDALLNGDGVGKPLGILRSDALVSIARAATSAISHADILNMWQRMSARNRNNAVWFINSEAEPQLDQLTFTSGSTGILSPYVNYSVTGVMQVKGRPVVVTEFNSALGTAGDILLADMSEYLFWEKGGVNTSVNPWLQWLTSEEAFKFTYRCDGQTSHYSPITPFKGSATQSAFVTLLATT